MEMITLDELRINDAIMSNDPVERNIIRMLHKLRDTNKRLKDHIEKTGSWAHLKDVGTWKPYDFYHYFCTKFQERYGREYHPIGNVLLSYKKIEEFMLVHAVKKSDYKKFIDIAFERYFNKVNVPAISNIMNTKLFGMLMDEHLKFKTADQYRDLDKELIREQDKFEKYVTNFNSL